MKTITIVLLSLLLSAGQLYAQELTALEIIQKSVDKLNGESSIGSMKMTVVRPTWSRSDHEELVDDR